MGSCHYCRTPISADVFQRHRLCPQCGSDLHCCKNCAHFNAQLTTQCAEPESPWIGNRLTENDCRYFELRRPSNDAPHDSTALEAVAADEAAKAKAAFEALFRPRR